MTQLLPLVQTCPISRLKSRPGWSGIQVVSFYSALAICMLLSESPSHGQYVAIIQSCNRDVAKSCAPSQPEGAQLTECIKVHFRDFSKPCQAALARIARVRESCGGDIQKRCPAIQPTGGRILFCIKRHFSALSELCKNAIGHAAERKVRSH